MNFHLAAVHSVLCQLYKLGQDGCLHMGRISEVMLPIRTRPLSQFLVQG